MIYSAGNMSLEVIRDVLTGEWNQVVICRDLNAQTKICYTVWMVKKHKTARELLEIFSLNSQGTQGYVTGFTYQDTFCFVFEHKKERRLQNFYMGRNYQLFVCETVCIRLIMECIACKIPSSVLYLILRQRRINLEKDFSIYFDYQIDLTEFDREKTEKDCVNQCAEILLDMLSVKESEKIISYELLNRKIRKESYMRFIDLYRDVCLAAVRQTKKRWYTKGKEILFRYQNGIFRGFLVFCIVLGIIALLMLFSQVILGDIPFIRLFYNTFREIGTESLLQ